MNRVYQTPQLADLGDAAILIQGGMKDSGTPESNPLLRIRPDCELED